MYIRPYCKHGDSRQHLNSVLCPSDRCSQCLEIDRRSYIEFAQSIIRDLLRLSQAAASRAKRLLERLEPVEKIGPHLGLGCAPSLTKTKTNTVGSNYPYHTYHPIAPTFDSKTNDAFCERSSRSEHTWGLLRPFRYSFHAVHDTR